MLDNETKKRIDDCRNILVGKVPDPKSQVEQITIAMIYKFMYDMDLESIEMGGVSTYFVGEYEKYSWSNIFNPRIGGNEMIALYGEGIVKMNLNPNIPQLFRDIFKNAYLPYRDPETLKLFLKGINEFHYSHSEKLGDAFEYLLSVLGSQGDAGQFRTPRHIIDFVVELINPKKNNEKILDPACGTSGFLISSYKHILRNNTKKNLGDLITPDERNKLVENFSGYDISPDMVRLSLVNLYLHNFSNPKIYEYDTLTSEERWNEYYDVILANPPFMSPKGGIKPHKRFSIQSNRAEVLFIDYIMEHLTPKGRSGIIVPEGIIFQSGTAYKSLRKSLVEKYLVGVVSLPSGVFQPYSGVKTSILILDKELSQKTDKIFFGKVDNDGFDLGSQRREIEKNDLPIVTKEVTEYLEGLRKGKVVESEKLTYVSKEQILGSSDISLSYDRYSMKEVFSSVYPIVELGELVEVLDSLRKPITKGDRKSGKYPYYGATGIVDYIDDFIFDERLVLVGEDGAKWLYGDSTSFIVEGKYWVNNHAHVLRVKKDKIKDTLLTCLLNYQDLSKYITGVTVPKLNQEKLRSIKLPLPPIEVQEEIVREIEQYQKIIDGAKQVVVNYNPVIEIDPNWEMKELGEITSLMTGGTPTSSKKEYYENGSINWVVSGDVNKEFIYDCEKKITELGMRSSNTKLIPIDSVLIALNGQGKTRGMVSILKTESTCNQSIISLTPINKNELSSYFLYYQLKGMYYEIRRLTGENERSGLNMKLVRSIKISLPQIEIQKSIVDRIESERQIIEGNKKLIEIYTQKIQDRINKIWGE